MQLHGQAECVEMENDDPATPKSISGIQQPEYEMVDHADVDYASALDLTPEATAELELLESSLKKTPCGKGRSRGCAPCVAGQQQCAVM